MTESAPLPAPEQSPALSDAEVAAITGFRDDLSDQLVARQQGGEQVGVTLTGVTGNGTLVSVVDSPYSEEGRFTVRTGLVSELAAGIPLSAETLSGIRFRGVQGTRLELSSGAVLSIPGLTDLTSGEEAQPTLGGETVFPLGDDDRPIAPSAAS